MLTDSPSATNDQLTNDCPAAPDEREAEFVNCQLAPQDDGLFFRSKTAHVIIMVVSCLILLLSVLLRSPNSESVELGAFTLPELCTFKRVFPIGCPGCGLTRSFISISHGDLATAFRLNFASFFVYAFVVAQIPFRAAQLFLVSGGRQVFGETWMVRGLVAIASLLVVQWCVRISMAISQISM